MARLPNRRRIMREDLKEAPSWIERLIGFINPFFEDIYYALNKQITHRENIDCDIRVIDFETSATYDSGVPDVSEIEKEISDINDEIGLINEEIEEIQEELENISGAPIGEVMLWCSLVSIPIGYVLANGQILSKTSYPDLYDVVGDTYNTGGEGPDEFRVPNYQGLVPRGWGSQIVNGNTKDGGVLGTVLEDQMQRIEGSINKGSANGGLVGGQAGVDIQTTGAFSHTTIATGVAASGSGYRYLDFTFDSSDSPNARTSEFTDGETRASSLSTVFLIKAFNASLATATQEAIDMLNAEVEQVKVDITNLSKRYIVNTHSSGNDWYEVYNDGWVRQGQYYHQAGATSYSRTFQIQMRSSSYTLSVSPHVNATSQIQYRSFGHTFTATGFSSYVGTSTDYISWVAEGFGDSAAVTALGATPDY